jgi:CBS domain-containing protein
MSKQVCRGFKKRRARTGLIQINEVGVERNTLVKEIARRMRDDDVGAPAVKANGHLVGIVTDHDIPCRAFANGESLLKLTAEDVMTEKVVCCSPDDDIEVAIEANGIDENSDCL